MKYTSEYEGIDPKIIGRKPLSSTTMNKYIFLIIVAIVFGFLIQINKHDCEYFNELIHQEYKGIVETKSKIKGDYVYELQTNKGYKKIWGINKEIDEYLMEGDSIYKKDFNKCLVIRKGETKLFQQFHDFPAGSYCDTIIKSN